MIILNSNTLSKLLSDRLLSKSAYEITAAEDLSSEWKG